MSKLTEALKAIAVHLLLFFLLLPVLVFLFFLRVGRR